MIVESCSLAAIGMGEILKMRWPAALIRHVRSGAEMQESLRHEKWDVVLIEIDLPDRSGLDLVAWARSAAPETRLLAMSAADESARGLLALRAGSAGYLRRGGPLEDLGNAVAAVLAGRRFIGRQLADTLARTVGQPKPDWGRFEQGLSPREMQILQALAKGERIKGIGAALAISPKTVSTYRARILTKMHFRNDADIVKYWWAKYAGGAPAAATPGRSTGDGAAEAR